MAKSSGVNRTIAKQVNSELTKKVDTLNTDLKKFKTVIENFNANTWHGGSYTMKWYRACDTLYGELKFFGDQTKVFQSDLQKTWNKNSTK